MFEENINLNTRQDLIDAGILSPFAGTYDRAPGGQADVMDPPDPLPLPEAPDPSTPVVDMRQDQLFGYPKKTVLGWAFILALAGVGIYFLAKRWS